MSDNNEHPMHLPRGRRRTPQSVIDATPRYTPLSNAHEPTYYLQLPIEMSCWGNCSSWLDSGDGDCSSAEEAFAKATTMQNGGIDRIFIPDAQVIDWATANNYVNEASDIDVLNTMQTQGFVYNNVMYQDGPYQDVDWTDYLVLRDAIYNYGPVKLAVNNDFFIYPLIPTYKYPSGTGSVTPNQSGWCMYNYPPSTSSNHCISVCGYAPWLGQMTQLFKEQGGITVNVPQSMPQGPCYAVFTWNSIGIVDAQSLVNMTVNAWVRTPVTISKKISQNQVGNNSTISSPFVTQDGWVWFQGTDGRLWKVFNDGTQQSNPGNNSTACAPFVAGEYVYFQGLGDDKLWRMKTDGSSQNQIGNNSTKSTPFVTEDGWVWFQGSDNQLWKVFNDGTQQSNPGNNSTLSSPFVCGDFVYFRGTDNRLLKMPTDGSSQAVGVGNNSTWASPFVIVEEDSNGEYVNTWVWFRGTDDTLWKVDINGNNQQNALNYTLSQPFALGNMVFFQGKNNALWQMKSDCSNQSALNQNSTLSSPFAIGDWVYFRATDNKLIRTNYND